MYMYAHTAICVWSICLYYDIGVFIRDFPPLSISMSYIYICVCVRSLARSLSRSKGLPANLTLALSQEACLPILSYSAQTPLARGELTLSMHLAHAQDSSV